MKKLLFFTVMLFAFAACKPQLSGYDFNKTIADDKYLVEKLVNNDSIKINFCEAQGVFSKNFIKNQKNYEVISVKTVFQVDSLVFIVTHPKNDYNAEPIVESYNDIWIGDLFSPIEVNIDLEKAINQINQSDIDAPESPFFVLRRPIVKPPFPKYLYYIFGSSKTGAIKVDSNSGEVTHLSV